MSIQQHPEEASSAVVGSTNNGSPSPVQTGSDSWRGTEQDDVVVDLLPSSNQYVHYISSTDLQPCTHILTWSWRTYWSTWRSMKAWMVQSSHHDDHSTMMIVFTHLRGGGCQEGTGPPGRTRRSTIGSVLTAIHENSRTGRFTIRVLFCAVGPGFFQVSLMWGERYQQFLDENGVNAPDWPISSSDLNPVRKLGHHILLQECPGTAWCPDPLFREEIWEEMQDSVDLMFLPKSCRLQLLQLRIPAAWFSRQRHEVRSSPRIKHWRP